MGEKTRKNGDACGGECGGGGALLTAALLSQTTTPLPHLFCLYWSKRSTKHNKHKINIYKLGNDGVKI